MRAYDAAVRLTRLTQATDLVADLLELELLIAHGNAPAAVSKANHLQSQDGGDPSRSRRGKCILRFRCGCTRGGESSGALKRRQTFDED